MLHIYPVDPNLSEYSDIKPNKFGSREVCVEHTMQLYITYFFGNISSIASPSLHQINTSADQQSTYVHQVT